ncbi:MAG: site-2 protease family protein [Planctomycetes bacterium]|nr:site-2 protease family protein [Planctomycetota bacterium]
MPAVFSNANLLLVAGGVLLFLLAQAARDAAFARAARSLGDDSATRAGRASFAPWAHVDPWRSLVLPIVLAFTTGIAFGCGRPLTLDATKLRRPQRDTTLIALAGPATSLCLALVLGLALLLSTRFAWLDSGSLAYLLLVRAIVTNVLLCVLHLIPLPPLDASRIVAVQLPPEHRAGYEGIGMYGVLFLVAAFFTPIGEVLTQRSGELPVWIDFVAQLVIP